MGSALLDRVRTALNSLLAEPWAPYAAAGLGAAIVLWVLASVLRRRRFSPVVDRLTPIHLADFGDAGPSVAGPSLELYRVPVRLAAAYLAPAGRGDDLPSGEALRPYLEAILPGLGKVAFAHHTPIVSWPAQVSAHGFAAQFFGRLSLPGHHGKGTCWSAIAGRFDYLGRPLLAGLVLRSAAPNQLGQFTCERATEWLDALRIQDAAPLPRSAER